MESYAHVRGSKDDQSNVSGMSYLFMLASRGGQSAILHIIGSNWESHGKQHHALTTTPKWL